MLVPNRNIWQTRIQTADALLTAASSTRREVYYLATVCQVGIEPILISISPNPEYPVCETIEDAGFFGLSFLAESQKWLIDRCLALDRELTDKVAALGVQFETTAGGTPLVVECLQAVECQVVDSFDCGDHRTFIGSLTGRRVRSPFRTHRPHIFRGRLSPGRRLAKRAFCQSGAYALKEALSRLLRPAVSIEEGTRLLTLPAEAGPRSAAAGGTRSTPATRPPLPGDASAAREEGRSVMRMTPAIPGICLVGCGWWGSVHALELKTLGPRIRRFFASRDPARAQEFASRYDGEALEDFGAAIADPRVDAVLICVPHHLHAELARQALGAGKHVLVEKPLAVTTEEGEELVHLADASGLSLAVAEQYRLSPLVARAKALIDQQALGQIVLAEASSFGIFRPRQMWKHARDSMGGGVLMDVGVHYIDVLRHWFGEPERVWAATPPHLSSGFEGEDSIVAGLRFPDGPLATLAISWASFRSPDTPNLELVGERGSLSLSFRKPYLIHTTPLRSGHWSRRLRRFLPWRIESRVRSLLPQARGQRIQVKGGDLIGSRALIEDFVHSITTGTRSQVPASEGLRDLRIVLAAYESIATGKPVDLS